MASAQILLAQFTASDLSRETSVGYDPVNNAALYATSNGASRGVRLQKLIQSQLTEYYNFQFIVPYNATFATGITIKYLVTDDGTNSADLGTVVRIGIQPFNLAASGALLDWSAGGGTETFQNLTLSSTSGHGTLGSIAIVAANLNSQAANTGMGIRIRRVGDNASDTCNGTVILYAGTVYDT